MTQTSVQISRQDPAIEAYRLGLLQAVKQFTDQQISGGVTPPAYQVAALGPNGQLMSAAEQAALSQAVGGVGASAPFVQGGLNVVGLGQQVAAQFGLPGVQQAMTTAQQAQPLLQRAGALAEATRDEPYMYRAAAQTGLGEATRLGTGLGTQGIQQLLGGITAGQAAAAGGAGALQNLAGGVGGQVGGAQTGADIAAARARASTAAAQQALMGAAGMGTMAAQQGIASLAGTGGRFDPTQISSFMSPFEDAAIQQSLADIARQGEIAQQNVRAQAVGAGAFGGSRQAVAEQELQRNILEQQGRTAAQMRAAGFESAANRAQQAFEQQQGRQQQLASRTGQLGQAGAGSALQAASQAGQLGLSAEQLAQVGALQGGQLGLSGIQQAGQLQNLASQLGLTAAAQQAAAGQNIGSLGVNLGQLGQAGAQAQGQLGLQFGQLGQQDVGILANLAAQQQALGQGIGGLATQFGTLGTQLGQLGLQQAGLGELATSLRGQDISQLMSTGAMQRGLEQSVLDARRMTEAARQAQPYQQYGFLSDIYAGVPTSQSTITASTVPQVSPFQTAIGLGIQGLSAAAGAQRAGLI